MVFTCPFISKSSSSRTSPFVTVPRAPITIGVQNPFYVPKLLFFFFQFYGKVQALFFSFAFFQFYTVVFRHSEVNNSAFFIFFIFYFIYFFFFIDYHYVWSSGRRLGERFVSQNPSAVCASHSPWQIIIIIIIIICSMRVFHINVSW